MSDTESNIRSYNCSFCYSVFKIGNGKYRVTNWTGFEEKRLKKENWREKCIVFCYFRHTVSIHKILNVEKNIVKKALAWYFLPNQWCYSWKDMNNYQYISWWVLCSGKCFTFLFVIVSFNCLLYQPLENWSENWWCYPWKDKMNNQQWMSW